MIKFLKQILLFFAIIISICSVVIIAGTELVESRDFQNDETEGNTLVFRNDKDYDLIVSGISHARNFSRNDNHDALEAILGKVILNIGQGENKCGVNEQFFYLKYFCSEGNRVKQLLYILSPPLLYSETLPKASNTFINETFSLKFLKSYLQFESEHKKSRIIQYLQSKLRPRWLLKLPDNPESMSFFLDSIDGTEVYRGFQSAYPEGKIQSRFEMSCKKIDEEIEFCKKNDIQFIAIIPPALFGEWPGHKETMEFAQRERKKWGIEFYDFSNAILDPKMYYDHHHLNSKGVEYFTEYYLKEILKK